MVALYGALFVAVAAMVAGVLYWRTNEILTRQVLAGLSAEVDALRALAQAGGPAALEAAIAERSRVAQGNLYYLAADRGDRIAGNLSRWPPGLDDRRGGLFRYTSTGADGADRLAVGIPLELPGGRHLLVARDVEDQLEFLARVRNLALAALGLLVVAGLAAAVAAGRLVLRRVEDITAASETIMAGDLSRRIPVTGSGDELDGLARSLNAMLDRIERLMAGLREVSDNIAHDLKTPLNRLRNRAEATLRDADSIEAYRKGLEGTIEAADELIKTFSALLLIARLEAGAVDESFAAFDLAALVRDIADLYEPLAQQDGLGLELAPAGRVETRANKQLIGQAVANLLDNAIKHGRHPASVGPGRPQGGRIEVGVARRGATVEVAVADRGPGIAAADRSRVLERFVRLEASRTRPGTGLGLSLVAAVARLHHGGVRLEDNAPGLRAVLWWPAGQREQPRP